MQSSSAPEPLPKTQRQGEESVGVATALRVMPAWPQGQEKETKHPSKATWCGMEQPGCPESPAAALVCSRKELKAQTLRKERRGPVKN